MKSIIPWCCLVMAASLTDSFAKQPLEAYRIGDYMNAKGVLNLEPDSPLVDYYQGRMRLYGYGQLKNEALAYQHFKKAADKGNLKAQKILGQINLMQKNNPEEALYWFKKAAALGDVSAQLYCAAAYQFGYGTKQQVDTAKKYYIDAAKQGNATGQWATAMSFLETKHGVNKQLGLIWLNKALKQHYPEAELSMADYLEKGQYVPKDEKAAMALRESAAKAGSLRAMMMLAQHAVKSGDYQQAKTWYLEAEKAKSEKATVELAKLYFDPKSPFYNLEAGRLLILKSAQNDNPFAMAYLSSLYQTGVGVKADLNLSKAWQTKASEIIQKRATRMVKRRIARWLTGGLDDNLNKTPYKLSGILNPWSYSDALKDNRYNAAPVMTNVNRLAIYNPKLVYTSPVDVDINDYFETIMPMLSHKAGEKWQFPHYPIDGSMAEVEKQYSFVLMHPEQSEPSINWHDFVYGFMRSDQKQIDYQKALNQLYGKAILGNSAAQFEIGQLYQYGIAVAQSLDQAKIYYELAAEQQDIRAEYNLGLLHLDTRYPVEDEAHRVETGMAWMTDAAFKGNEYAQYALARIYAEGYPNQAGDLVVQPDQDMAVSMYHLAAANHFGEAAYQLAELMAKQPLAVLTVSDKKAHNAVIESLYSRAVDQGVGQARLPLAFYQALGRDPVKQQQAFEIAQSEARNGEPLAALLLGMMHDRGIATPMNHATALYWYQQAPLNPVNAFILGTYYATGQGVNEDLKKADQLLSASAEGGFSYGHLNLAVLKEKAHEPFLSHLETALSEGNVAAGLLLADYYIAKADNPDKMLESRQIYQKFADKGDRQAQLKLGYLYDTGLGGAQDALLAKQAYEASAAQGHPIAGFLLARLYQLGRIGENPDEVSALSWYSRVKDVYAPAAVALGFLKETVDDDYAAATLAYQLAAKQGSADAAFNLGLIYDEGKGIERNPEQAALYYQTAAEKGHVKAMNQLAGLYFSQSLGQHEEAKALNWYQKAAQLGDSDALYQLGLLSETGLLIPLDYAKAVGYYEKSAAQGHEPAQLALARMNEYGLGVPKSRDHAMDIYKALAENNHAYAQYQLATMALDARYAPTNPEQAKLWLEKASLNGHRQSQRLLDWLNARTESRLSFVEPLVWTTSSARKTLPPDRMYFNALSAWNQGEEASTRDILKQLMRSYPDYSPAHKAYQNLNQSMVLTGLLLPRAVFLG